MIDRFEELQEMVVPVLKPYVSRISVYGSFARGEELPESDIDFLLQLKPLGQRRRSARGFLALNRN